MKQEQNTKADDHPTTLSDDDVAAIRKLLTIHSEREITARLEVSRQTFARSMAQMPMRSSTVFMIHKRLEDWLKEIAP